LLLRKSGRHANQKIKKGNAAEALHFWFSLEMEKEIL